MKKTAIKKNNRIIFAVVLAIIALCAIVAARLFAGDISFTYADSVIYYAALDGVTPEGDFVDINGAAAYPLTEDDSRYVSGKYFVSAIDTKTEYTVYRADTDVNGEVTYTKALEGEADEADVGYYYFKYDPSHIYSSSGAYTERITEDYGGWFMSDQTNNYLYTSSGELKLDDPKKFREVETDDSEYSRVYNQYKLNIMVEDADLAGGDLLFCITNGTDIYKAGDNYIRIAKTGIYRIIFCEDRIYDNGYHYTVTERNSTPAADTDYYLCLSTQDYAVLKTNVLTDLGGYEYSIENVSLSSSVKFYICDENGSVWYDKDGNKMSVAESTTLSYDIKFSPNAVYSNQSEWESTDCHITYKYYSPASYSLTVNSSTYSFTYNSTVSDYDEYYISSLSLCSGDALSVSGYSQVYTVSTTGYYRILFTPGETKSGDYYCFNSDGEYGAGDGYSYNIYVEKAPLYYAVYLSDVSCLPTADAEIEGAGAYLLTRDETSTLTAYEGEEFFVGEKDFTLKVKVYEYITSSSTYKEVSLSDDSLSADYVGYYTLSFVSGEGSYAYVTSADKSFGGYYIAGSFNGYCYTSDGEKNLSSDYRFSEVDEDADDYTEDYTQYILYVEVTSNLLKNGDYSFYITDGADRYTNAGDYITLSEVGRYKILFSPEHIYGRGRYYRYTLQYSSVDKEDLEISTADEFIAFATACNADAEYSVGLNVYITSDIDFSGREFISVKLFCGYLNGGYHTLKNITIESDGETVAGAFKTLSKAATVERLTVENLNISAENGERVGFVGENYGTLRLINTYGAVTGKNYVGGIVGYNGRSAIESGDTVEDSSENYVYARVEKCYSSCTVVGKVNVGGIAGYNGGKIISTAFEGESNASAHSSSDRIVNTGGIAGYSTGKIDSCVNTGTVGYVNTGVYVGGIVGFSSGEAYFSKNTGSVSGSAYVGGIVGYLGALSDEGSSDSLSSYFGGMTYEEFVQLYFSDDGDDFSAESDGGIYFIIYCINGGDITAENYAGGIVGRISAPSTSTASSSLTSSSETSSEADVKVDSCISYGSAYVSAGDYAGGIAGYQSSGKIINCISAGDIKAEGVSAGGYVGGIAGYGAGDIYYCASFCSLSGTEYVGGIAGLTSGKLIGSYTDCIILTPDSSYCGQIAGAAESYVAATGDFGDSVSDNFFIGDVGGIDGMNYGALYGYAACYITAEELVSVGNLSAYLSDGFSSDNWIGSLTENGYPVLKSFEEVISCDEYGAEEDFNKAFEAVKDELYSISQKYCVRSYTVTFLEWNEDEGDLYDGDDINKDNFEVIYTARLRYGEEVYYPAFKYAEVYGEKYIFDGDEASYFVSWNKADPFASDKTLVYASYVEVATTLASSDESVLAEGKFPSGETVEIVYSGEYFTLEFYIDGEKVTEENITVKILSDGTDKSVYKVEGQSLTRVESRVSGNYIAFTFNGGYYAIVENEGLPAWAFALIGAGGALVAGAIVLAIVFAVRSKRSRKEEETEEKEE